MVAKGNKGVSIREYLKSDSPLPDEILEELIKFREETAELDYKESFDPNSKRDWPRLAKHIIAMANTRGGYIILGVSNDYDPVGMDKTVLESIDIANVLNKVNSFVEPDIEGIRYKVFNLKSKYFGVIFVPKSSLETHVIKKIGNYQDAQGKVICELSRGHIYVRHGAKSEPITHSDISRIINQKIQQHKDFWLKGIRKISTARIPAEVIVSPKDKGSLSVRLTTDPRAPAVRGILDRDKCKSISEELICSLKTWKTRPESYLITSQLAKIYSVRKEIEDDEEIIEFIIRSSLQNWMPVFYWTTRLERNKLEKILRSIVERDEHPSARECLKVILMLDKKFAKDTLKVAIYKSHLHGAKSDAQKFLEFIDKGDRYKALFNIGSFIKFSIQGKEEKIRIKDLLKKGSDSDALLDKISSEFAENSKCFGNKWALKILDMIVFGFKLL